MVTLKDWTRILPCAAAIALIFAASFQPAAARGQDDSVGIGDAEEFSDPQVRVCPDGKYESGCDRGDISDAIVITEDFPAGVTDTCLFQTKARCAVTAYGRISKTALGGPVTWQHLEIYPKDGPRIEMLVLVETSKEGPTNLVTARQTEGWYGVPEVVQDSDGVLMIHAPGRTGGTGAGNVDVVLTRHQMGWTGFDVNIFLELAEKLLPEGFSLGRGANFNFREMIAIVPVSREGDGGCCATGGTAFINLGLPRSNWMQVDSVTFEETSAVKTHRIAGTEYMMDYEEPEEATE